MFQWSFQRKLVTGVAMICVLAVLTSVASIIASRVLISEMTKVATGEGRVLDTEGRALLDRVIAAEQAHRAAFARALAVQGASPKASAAQRIELIRGSGARFDSALAALLTHVESARFRGLVSSRAAVAGTERLLIVITLMTIVLLALLCLMLVATLGRSYRLQTTARTLAETGQSQARESLSEVEAIGHMKDEFLATVSHELRNPLAPILTWTQLLRSGTLDKEKTARALEVIERNVLSQTQLIDDLVDVSRVVSGKFRLDVRPVDLLPVIKAAADSQTPASDARQIRMQLVLDERAGRISGDSERLLQVMSNLISNAIKFTPKGGRVQVVLQRAESHIEISVTDSGIGIEPGFLPHVFEPFRQGTAGTMRRHGGLGLGLSIVRHIVELHGGEITAYSDGAGLGSKFTVKLPMLATGRELGLPMQRHPIAGDSLAEVHLGRLDGIRVLVVDDEPSASEALGVLFNSCGAEARVVGSAAEALVLFDAWQPDVLVSDIAMPEEDGYSLIRKIRLRAPERGGLVPAVALTAFAKIEDRVTILAAGFQMYLSKPANPNELVAVVSSLAKRPGLRVEDLLS